MVLKALAHRPNLNPLLVGCRKWLQASYEQLLPRCGEPLADPSQLEIIDEPLSEAIRPGSISAAAGAASFTGSPGQRRPCSMVALRPWSPLRSPKRRGTKLATTTPGKPNASLNSVAVTTQRCCSPPAHRKAAGVSTPCWPPPTFHSAAFRPLTPERLERRLNQLENFCRRFSQRPRLRVAGLNPHAGKPANWDRRATLDQRLLEHFNNARATFSWKAPATGHLLARCSTSLERLQALGRRM